MALPVIGVVQAPGAHVPLGQRLDEAVLAAPE
jgi:hypothetical protein